MEENVDLLSKLIKIEGCKGEFEEKLYHRLIGATKNRNTDDVRKIGKVFYNIGQSHKLCFFYIVI